MLQTFREHSGGIFAKIIFGLIIASFALFGVGDMFRTYTSRRPLATVGGTTIAQEEFQRDYDQMMKNVQVAFKGKITPAEIKSLGIQTRVLNGLIDRTLIQNEIHHLDLVVSNEVLAQTIQSIPAFHNESGRFDKERFIGLLQSNGQSEGMFTKQLRSSLQEDQLFSPFVKGIGLPLSYEEKLYRALHEEYVFATVYVPLTSVKITQVPQESELEAVYKQNTEFFTRPALYDVSLLVVNPTQIQQNLSLTDEQVQEEYQRRLSDFELPETRDVVQLTFTSKEVAAKAHDRLAAGESVEKVATELGGKIQKYVAAPRDKFSHAHADVIFSKPQPFVSDLTDSLMGWSIFSVTGINPVREQTLDEVRSKIEEDLKIRLASEKMDELRNEIEDKLAGGDTVDNVAKHHGFEVIKLGSITKKGLDAQGKSVIPEQYKTLVLDNAFALQKGMDTPVLDGSEGKMLVIHMNNITPKTLPSLGDIRQDVVAYWQKVKQQEKAAQFAQQLSKEATSMAAIEALAKKNNLVLKTLSPLSLFSLQENKAKDDIIGPQALQKGFKLAPNHADYAPVKDGFAVIMLKEVKPFNLSKDDEKWKKFQEYLTSILQKDFQAEYIKALKAQQKVDVDQSILDRVSSGQVEPTAEMDLEDL